MLLDDGTELRAERLIHALGAEAVSLGPQLPIRKRKGHLVITDRYPGFVHHQLVELGYLKSAHSTKTDSVAFNVQPRATGQLLIGSSRQYGAEYPETDQHILSAMLARATLYMPDLARHRSRGPGHHLFTGNRRAAGLHLHRLAARDPT